MRPARCSTLRCLVTAGRLMSNGSASSVTEASPDDEPREDGAARGIRQCREGGAELIDAIQRYLVN